MFKLKIETKNAAFHPYTNDEIIRILKEDVIPKLEAGAYGMGNVMHDINGNGVGEWTLNNR